MVCVISCEFLRCSKENHALFRREYARTNRERGVKLLRCFPHCCPDHVKRSYCGCSVHVLVTFSTDVRAVNLDDILECARFEPTRVAPLWSDSLVGLAQDLGAPGPDDSQENRRLDVGESVTNLTEQGESSDDGWVRGERVRQQHLPNNTVLYVLNRSKSPKWFYRYDSSVTRTQREMTHHLVAYALRLQDNQSATVLALHASPAFMLVSYRRSRGADRSGCTVPATDISRNNDEQVTSPCIKAQKRPSEVVYQRKRQYVGAVGGREAQEDSSLWQLDAEGCYPGFREKGLHLLILLEFLQCLSVEDIGVNTRLASIHWLRAFSAFQSPLSAQFDDTVESFLGEIFRDAEGMGASPGATIQVTVYFLLRATLSSMVQRLIRSALQGSSGRLHGGFALLVSCVYDFLDCLTRDSSHTPLSTLVDYVLSLVYRQRRFEGLRGQLSSFLMGQQASGPLPTALNRLFYVFKAQVLQYDQPPLSKASFTERSPLQSAWSRRWLLEPGSVKLSDGISSNQWGVIPTLRVVDVAQFECGCVDVEVESDMSCWTIRSALSIVCGSSSVAMQLVLDGRLRPVSKLPSGLVAALGWSFSDYAASFSEGGQSLDLDLFAFSERRVILRRIRLNMSLEQQLSTQVLCSVNPTSLSVLVQGGISGTIFQPRDFGDEFSTLPIQERAAVYESLGWTPLIEAQAGYIAIPERSAIG